MKPMDSDSESRSQSAGPASLFHVILQFALAVVKSMRGLRFETNSH